MATENGGASTSNDYSTLTNVSDLGDIVLKRYGQSMNSDPKQAEIVEKLRALQVVEEMIKSQEYLLTGHAEIPAGSNKPNNLLNPKTLEGETKTSEAPPKPVLHAWTESALKTSSSPPPEIPVEEPMAEQTDAQTISSTSSVMKKSVIEERKVEQLELLNAKIAQRHSKVHKSGTLSFTGTHGPRATAGSSKFKKMTQPRKLGVKSLESGKTITKTPGVNQRALKSKEQSVKGTKHSSSVTTSASKSKTKPLVSKTKSKLERSRLPRQPFTKDHLPGIPIHASESAKPASVKHSPVYKPDSMPQPSPSKHEPSFSAVTTDMSAPNTSSALAHTDTEADMLNSTSYYFPVSEDAFGENILVNQFEAALEQDSQCGSSLLASSLTQAYGLSGLTESSELLSTLQIQGHVDSSTHQPSLSQKTDIEERQARFVQSTQSDGRSVVTDDKLLSPSIAPYQLGKTNGQVEVGRNHGKVESRAATVIQAVW